MTSNTKDLDVELLLEARAGEVSAISTLYVAYRERLMTLADSAGVVAPVPLVQSALTHALLAVEPHQGGVEQFEQELFARVMADLVELRDAAEADAGDRARDDAGDELDVPALAVLTAGIAPMAEPVVDPVVDHSAAPASPMAPAPPTHPADPIDGAAVVDGVVLTGGLPTSELPGDAALLDGGPLPDGGPLLDGGPFLDGGPLPDGGALLDAGPTPEVAPVLDDAGPAEWSSLVVPPTIDESRLDQLRRAGTVVAAIGCAALVGAAAWFLLAGDDDASVDGTGPALVASPTGGDTAVSADDGAEQQSRSVVTAGDDDADGPIGGPDDADEPLEVSTTEPESTTSEPPSSETTEPGSTSTPTTAETTTTGSTSTTVETTASTTTEPPTTVTSQRPTTTERTTTTRRREGDFRGQEIENTSFRGADLRGYDFTGANLRNVVFSRSDLEGVSLAGATLVDVRFTNVDLTDASLRGADLDNVTFEFTNISGVDFTGSSVTNGEVSGYFSPLNPPINVPGWDDDDYEGDD